VIDWRELFLDNPELRRNLRIELRPKRVVTAGIITAVVALVVLPSVLTGNRSGNVTGGASSYLMVVMWSQKITLTLGGAISCWRSVKRERELNTFDFQRITRLSPLELAVGKLLGAPALAYFVTLCLVLPGVLSAITTSNAALGMLLQSYVLLFTSSLVIHAFALMISTISDKGGAFSGVIILLLLQLFPLIGWLSLAGGMASAQSVGGPAAFRFYGVPIPAMFLWAALELGFAAWLLLAVVRNIKIDLEAMQLFTVPQGLGFAAYCNFVWIGFFPWGATSRGYTAGALLLFGVAFFYLVGIGVLKSRELVRSGLREARVALTESGKWLGPIRMMVVGAVVTEIVIVVLAEQNGVGDAVRRMALNLFLVLYFAAWLARDLLYLQWMKIRPVRTPLRKAFLYLAVFYVTASIVFRGAMTSGDSAAFAAWLVPFPVAFPFTNATGESAPAMWLLALMAQFGAAAAFAYLYRQEVVELGSRPKAAPPAGPARLSSTAA
jgi:hypothetical protein